jgi:UDP-N-acetylglucosamine--N-acetylmuramyl-(pentapeptide) pyrophosphoryl-undecaprenol N-acetylglucosamine transferase
LREEYRRLKRIILTGGGTAGHVTPHLALVPRLLKSGYEVHYIGTEKGIEREIMNLPGIVYHPVQSGKLRRYYDARNFTDPFRVALGMLQAVFLIRKIRPDVCFSKGGFVSVPVVMGAWLNHVPVLCHESDLTPGLANRICARFSKRVATTFPECAAALGTKGVLTGTPLRPALFGGSREKGLAMAGFTGDKPVLLMMGGSLGAQSVNAVLRAALPRLLPSFHVLHLCGKGNLNAALNSTEGYWQAEYLNDELPDALAAADLILSRAGSNALCEFQALQKPMLLVPYPKGASRGDQILNAESFRARGLAKVLRQEDLTPDSLAEAVAALHRDSGTIRSALASAPAADGTKEILRLIEDIQHR